MSNDIKSGRVKKNVNSKGKVYDERSVNLIFMAICQGIIIPKGWIGHKAKHASSLELLYAPNDRTNTINIEEIDYKM